LLQSRDPRLLALNDLLLLLDGVDEQAGELARVDLFDRGLLGITCVKLGHSSRDHRRQHLFEVLRDNADDQVFEFTFEAACKLLKHLAEAEGLVADSQTRAGRRFQDGHRDGRGPLAGDAARSKPDSHVYHVDLAARIFTAIRDRYAAALEETLKLAQRARRIGSVEQLRGQLANADDFDLLAQRVTSLARVDDQAPLGLQILASQVEALLWLRGEAALDLNGPAAAFG
jgi:hypothetical protein